ncbi:MAG: hypothetical protein HY289_04600 [Planctomycetes bacterium]|nr:hypothetical protein [Planctomycetota bacterium]
MVSWPILWEHLSALALVWAAVALPGFALLPVLRLRIGLVGAPLLGVVYWTVALYLFPFHHGLDVAAGLVGAAAIFHGIRVQGRLGLLNSVRRWRTASTLILVTGSLPYLTTLLAHYVPQGMDASMHATAATLIGRSAGLPSSYAPFAPDVNLPPMNLGLPAIAGVAIRWGGEPAAVMLACHHLTFTALILASYLLLRWWTGRNVAAFLAVLSVWTARATQASVEWGGFPTILSVAIGLFAARLLLQHMRSVNWRLSIATGAAVAALPLIHGVGAGTWLYCVGPWVVFATIFQSRSRIAMLRGLALSGLTAVLMLIVYRAAGTIDAQALEMTWTRQWQEESAPLGERPWLGSFDYIRKNAGSVIVLAGWFACGLLAWRRQWPAAALLGLAWLSMTIVVANSHWWVLPASFLLYPERVLYWAAPLSAVGLALAWRSYASSQRKQEGVHPLLALRACKIALLAFAAYQHNQFYQKAVRDEVVDADGWEALVWAKQHLEPTRDFVYTPYNSTGSFLPAIAQVGCTGSHHHHFLAQQVRQHQGRRTVTHVFVDEHLAPGATLPTGTVVFRNRSITIMEMGNGNASAKRR